MQDKLKNMHEMCKKNNKMYNRHIIERVEVNWVYIKLNINNAGVVAFGVKYFFYFSCMRTTSLDTIVGIFLRFVEFSNFHEKMLIETSACQHL